MNKFTLALCCLLLYIGGFSQLKSKFGSLTMEESNLKQCSFDPEASAVVLLDEGFSDFDGTHGLISWFHTRIKILKEDGRKYADVKLRFYHDDEFEFLDNLQAQVINLDENGRRKDSYLDNKSFFYKKLNKYWTEVTFAMPDVKVGSIIEYKYRVIAKHYGGLRDWEFQSDIPVINSSYKLIVVPGHEVSYLVQYNPKYKVDYKHDKSEHSIWFAMNNIPALTEEPYMDSREDYIQKIIFQTTKYVGVVGQVNYMSTWKEVSRELLSRPDFGRQLKINVDESKDFIASIQSKNDIQKMQLVHHYVTSNFSWNGEHGIIATDGIKSLVKTKKGNAAQINLLMVNLLREAGLEAYPMVVSERGNGRVNKDQPFIQQFNNVYAAVFVGNKKYYLDGTDKYTPSHIIPYSILNTTGFIVDNKASELIDIKENEIKYHDQVIISSFLKEDGELTGSVNMESSEYARSQKLHDYVNNKTDYVDNYIRKGLVNVDVDNFSIKNLENDSLPFTQGFDFKTHVQATDDYSFINLNMFTGLENNPFIVNDRFSNINFGYKKSLFLTYVVNLPPNYKVDALPKSIKLVNPDQSVTFTRELYHEKSQLMVRIKVNINRSLFDVNEYAGIKDFFKQMVNLMNEQVVLKKI